MRNMHINTQLIKPQPGFIFIDNSLFYLHLPGNYCKYTKRMQLITTSRHIVGKDMKYVLKKKKRRGENAMKLS